MGARTVRVFKCYLVLVSAILIRNVAASTNKELYKLLTENLEDAEENYVSYYDDVTTSDDDDTLILPGNADDEVDIEYLMTKLFLGSANTDDVTGDTPLVGRTHCHCRHDSCQCCIRKTWKVRVWFKKFKARLNACLKVEYLPRDFGFRVTFTVNGRRLFKHEVSLKHPPSLCYNVPGLGRFARICLQIYNVDLRRKRVCARLVGKLNLVFKRFHIRLKLGCFRIPIFEADRLQEMKQWEEIFEDVGDTDNADADIAEIFRNTQDDSNDGDDLPPDDLFENPIV